ncbi:zona pellucida sperm-binding protein 3-like isoform X2 [Betta splendens]|uniref:Zona pellucida sperm-binding protein 3 n=1 Tax=Betta splendens TaxID=158456 RepID=A0A6P7N6L2_BETSP|nr:zona pellucida sperm-binding protein 3-like isoform X2 [Betta splendens]
METSCVRLRLLAGLLCVQWSFAFAATHLRGEFASREAAPPARSLGFPHTAHAEPRPPAGERGKARTVRVSCRPDSLEVVIKADLFGVGVPVDGDELRLGVEDSDRCRAAASSGDEYRIVAGLVECGTKHWITKEALIYTNLLIYAPVESPYGLIRMDEAVVPIECHYQRKYRLSSASLAPTWVPFTSTKASMEALRFDLQIMTDDWRFKRSSNVFHLGESISMEASVRVGHHVRLRVFMSSCVATLSPDTSSTPRYAFIEHGCLMDSKVSRSTSHFLPRTQEHKLRLVIDAFKFNHEDSGRLYITCQLNAVPVNYAEASYKACTFTNRRWRSADGNDYSCRYCQSQAGQSWSERPDEPGAGGMNNVFEQEARVGPVLFSPAKHKPVGEHSALSRRVPYGSQWRSGIIGRAANLETGLFPLSTPDLVEEDEEDEADFNDLELEEDDETDLEINDVEKALLPVLTSTQAGVKNDDQSLNDLEEGLHLGPEPEGKDDKGATELKEETAAAPLDVAAELNNNSMKDLHDISPTSQVKVDVPSVSNEVTDESGLRDPNDPKR